jgi:hypothetical protein
MSAVIGQLLLAGEGDSGRARRKSEMPQMVLFSTARGKIDHRGKPDLTRFGLRSWGMYGGDSVE